MTSAQLSSSGSVGSAVLLFIAEGASFDCNDPADGYTCHGGRYYRKRWNHWKKSHEKCAADGTQLAIPYSAQDLDAMNEIGKGDGKLGARQCNKFKGCDVNQAGNGN